MTNLFGYALLLTCAQHNRAPIILNLESQIIVLYVLICVFLPFKQPCLQLQVRTQNGDVPPQHLGRTSLPASCATSTATGKLSTAADHIKSSGVQVHHSVSRFSVDFRTELRSGIGLPLRAGIIAAISRPPAPRLQPCWASQDSKKLCCCLRPGEG